MNNLLAGATNPDNYSVNSVNKTEISPINASDSSFPVLVDIKDEAEAPPANRQFVDKVDSNKNSAKASGEKTNNNTVLTNKFMDALKTKSNPAPLRSSISHSNAGLPGSKKKKTIELHIPLSNSESSSEVSNTSIKAISDKAKNNQEPTQGLILRTRSIEDEPGEDRLGLIGSELNSMALISKSNDYTGKAPSMKSSMLRNDSIGANSTGKSSTRSSMSSGGGGRHPGARELSESLTGKLYEARWVFISLFTNSLLLTFQLNLQIGIIMPFSTDVVRTFGAVAIEILFLFTNVLTIKAVNDGTSFHFLADSNIFIGTAIYFGYHLASKRGYSLAVCGFYQSHSLSKWTFCNNLSLNSKCRKWLSRISPVWILLEILRSSF